MIADGDAEIDLREMAMRLGYTTPPTTSLPTSDPGRHFTTVSQDDSEQSTMGPESPAASAPSALFCCIGSGHGNEEGRLTIRIFTALTIVR